MAFHCSTDRAKLVALGIRRIPASREVWIRLQFIDADRVVKDPAIEGDVNEAVWLRHLSLPVSTVHLASPDC